MSPRALGKLDVAELGAREEAKPSREGEQGRRQMLEVADADLELKADFVHVKGAPRGCRKTLAELVDANDGVLGLHDGAWVASRVARVHRVHRRGGPTVRIRLPPAARSRANPDVRAHVPGAPIRAPQTLLFSGTPRRRNVKGFESVFLHQRFRVWTGDIGNGTHLTGGGSRVLTLFVAQHAAPGTDRCHWHLNRIALRAVIKNRSLDRFYVQIHESYSCPFLPAVR